jgi:hypothetical protein
MQLTTLLGGFCNGNRLDTGRDDERTSTSTSTTTTTTPRRRAEEGDGRYGAAPARAAEEGGVEACMFFSPTVGEGGGGQCEKWANNWCGVDSVL